MDTSLNVTETAVSAPKPTYRQRCTRVSSHGFRRGSVAEQNDGECDACGKRIQTTRSWWTGGGGECDDGWEGYCLACAEKKVERDEAMWADYADPKLMAEYDELVDRKNAELAASET